MRRTWHWTVLVVGVIAGGSYGLYVYLQPPAFPDQVLYGNGHIEGREIRVAAEAGGRVVESHLVEGTPVDAGALLVRIDDADPALQMRRTEAEVGALQRSREQTERELEIARHHLETARQDLVRYRELLERDGARAQNLAGDPLDPANLAEEDNHAGLVFEEAMATENNNSVETEVKELQKARKEF